MYAAIVLISTAYWNTLRELILWEVPMVVIGLIVIALSYRWQTPVPPRKQPPLHPVILIALVLLISGVNWVAAWMLYHTLIPILFGGLIIVGLQLALPIVILCREGCVLEVFGIPLDKQHILLGLGLGFALSWFWPVRAIWAVWQWNAILVGPVYWLLFALLQLGLVALPQELFFRVFIQTDLEHITLFTKYPMTTVIASTILYTIFACSFTLAVSLSPIMFITGILTGLGRGLVLGGIWNRTHNIFPGIILQIFLGLPIAFVTL